MTLHHSPPSLPGFLEPVQDGPPVDRVGGTAYGGRPDIELALALKDPRPDELVVAGDHHSHGCWRRLGSEDRARQRPRAGSPPTVGGPRSAVGQRQREKLTQAPRA